MINNIILLNNIEYHYMNSNNHIQYTDLMISDSTVLSCNGTILQYHSYVHSCY